MTDASAPINLAIYQVDAFTDRLFKGNPAAVMPLKSWLPDSTLQALAAENNLSETAFLVPQGEDYAIRWFTPATEVPLCGHATLAAAHVVFNDLYPGRDQVTFHSRERGPLPVRKGEQGRLVLDFPATALRRVVMPDMIAAVLGTDVLEVQGYLPGELLAVLPSAEAVRSLTPHLLAFGKIKAKGIIVTAEAGADEPYDFVCRYFAPGLGIDEDPVTGSIHTALAPFWAKRSGKTALLSYQASSRGGLLACTVLDERVEIAGHCAFYLRGTVSLTADLA
jgi:PhzF family phenazine biosynthesis protein